MNRHAIGKGAVIGIVAVVIVLVAAGVSYFVITRPSSTSQTVPLVVGSYAQYTGKVSAGIVSENETVRLQVVAINSTALEWIQSQTVGGQNSQSTYWVKAGASPFHYSRANDTFTPLKTSDTVRLIGSTTYSVTVAIYQQSGVNGTYTYYMLKSTSPIYAIIPLELSTQVTTTSSGNFTFTASEDLYLTSTNIAGLNTVQP